MAKAGTQNLYLRVLLILAGLLAFAVNLTAQTDSSSSADKQEEKKVESKGADDGGTEGQVWGDYKVRQSVEFGAHIVDSSGSPQMYNTFVNLHTGPRLLSTEMSMESLAHTGVLFDKLYLSSFGLGGDPETFTRLRIQKDKWYNFVGVYRQDKNYFDYNLFANPLNLNQGITTCGGPVGGPPTCVNLFTPSDLSWYTNSPHAQFTTRNMGDFSLTLLPESAISFRLGYARNNTHGRLDTTLEAPLRSLITEDSQWRSDRYQFGVDVRVFPRTTISGDVFVERDKNDFAFVDNNLLYRLGNNTGPVVDIGILLPPLAGSISGTQCSNGSTVSINGQFFIINNACRAILLSTGPGGAYFKRGNLRTTIPTGQISFQSNYFRRVEFTASGTYSAAGSDFLNFNEFMHGTVPRGSTQAVADQNTGDPFSQRISANADGGMTIFISKHWTFSERFRWVNWRETGGFTNTLFRCLLTANTPVASPNGFPAGPVTVTPFLNPCNPGVLSLTGLTTAGNATGGIYQQTTTDLTVLGERSYYNTAKLSWQPNRYFQGYLGYRYGRRTLRLGDGIAGIIFEQTATATNNGTGNPPALVTGAPTVGELESERISYHTGLLGVVVRPITEWRINADVEVLSADNFFTNIAPRNQQRFRIYTRYKPKDWLSLNGGVHLVETRNGFGPGQLLDGSTTTLLFPSGGALSPYGHKDHWRYYTFGASLNPNSKFFLDLGYTYLNQDIKSATCMPLPANAFTGLVAPTVCSNGATARAVLLDYRETTHSGYTMVSFKPVKRLTLNLGYEITADNGRTDWLRLDTGQPLMVVGDIYGNVPALTGNPLSPCPGDAVAAGCVFPGPFPDQPLGPQAINWHKLNAGLSVDIVRGIQFKGVWSYYNYNSKDEVPALVLLQVTSPRDFHANVGTLSLKYSF